MTTAVSLQYQLMYDNQSIDQSFHLSAKRMLYTPRVTPAPIFLHEFPPYFAPLFENLGRYPKTLHQIYKISKGTLNVYIARVGLVHRVILLPWGTVVLYRQTLKSACVMSNGKGKQRLTQEYVRSRHIIHHGHGTVPTQSPTVKST